MGGYTRGGYRDKYDDDHELELGLQPSHFLVDFRRAYEWSIKPIIVKSLNSDDPATMWMPVLGKCLKPQERWDYWVWDGA